jgi:hypothetical protein
MVVYLLHEWIDDLHTTLGVFASKSKASSVAKDISNMAGLELQNDGLAIVEYCNNDYDHVVWVEEMDVIQ